MVTNLHVNRFCGLHLGRQLGTSDLNKYKNQVTDCMTGVMKYGTGTCVRHNRPFPEATYTHH